MQDPEETIEQSMEKVFAGLRESEPPAGMNARILRTLQDGTPHRTRAGGRSWKFAAASIPCAAVMAILLLAPRVEHVAVRLANPHTETSDAQPRIDSREHTAQIAPRGLQARLDRRRTDETVHARRVRGIRVTAPRLASMVNQPAPPLPLTEQEKLLLQLARHRNPANLAILNPDRQAKQIAEEKKQFQQFFTTKTAEELIAESSKGQL